MIAATDRNVDLVRVARLLNVATDVDDLTVVAWDLLYAEHAPLVGLLWAASLREADWLSRVVGHVADRAELAGQHDGTSHDFCCGNGCDCVRPMPDPSPMCDRCLDVPADLLDDAVGDLVYMLRSVLGPVAVEWAMDGAAI